MIGWAMAYLAHPAKPALAIASGVLQQVDNLYISEGLHPPHLLLQILGLILSCWHNIETNRPQI